MDREAEMSYWNNVRQRLNSLVGNFGDFELVVNGVALTPAQIAAFKRITCLPVLEPGRFWFDAASGAMGKEGSPWPMYHLYTGASAPLARSGSLSERRMLFNEADLTGIWLADN
jgi:hypothetical protein